METVRTYTQTVAKLEANPEIAPLVAAVIGRRTLRAAVGGQLLGLSVPL
jgi:hypothetical protein